MMERAMVLSLPTAFEKASIGYGQRLPSSFAPDGVVIPISPHTPHNLAVEKGRVEREEQGRRVECGEGRPPTTMPMIRTENTTRETTTTRKRPNSPRRMEEKHTYPWGHALRFNDTLDVVLLPKLTLLLDPFPSFPAFLSPSLSTSLFLFT